MQIAVYYGATWCTCKPKLKNKKPCPKKVSYIFSKKLFLYLGKRNFVICFLKRKLKKMEVSSLKNKKLRKASKVENPL